MPEVLDKQKLLDKLDFVKRTLERENKSPLRSQNIYKTSLNDGSIAVCNTLIKFINEGMFDKED